MVQSTKDPRKIVEQLQETRADMLDLLLLTEAHAALTGNNRSISSVESAYYHVKDALNDAIEFAEYLEGESL